MTTQSGEFSLEAKYTRSAGASSSPASRRWCGCRSTSTGPTARAGSTPPTFISGYRGSPLGGFDQTLERNRRCCSTRHHVVFSRPQRGPRRHRGVSAARWRASSRSRSTTACSACGTARRPGVDRTGDAFKHANYAGVGQQRRRARAGGDDPLSKSSTLPSALRGRALRRAHAGALPRQRAGDPRPRACTGFDALARTPGCGSGVKIVTNVADEIGTAEVGPERVEPGRSRRSSCDGQPCAAPRSTRTCSRPTASTWSATIHDGAPRGGPALRRTRTGSTGSRSPDAGRVARHRRRRQDLLRGAPGARRAGAGRRRAAPLRRPPAQDRHAVPAGAAIVREFARGLRGDPRRRGEARLPRAVRAGRRSTAWPSARAWSASATSEGRPLHPSRSASSTPT